MTQRLPNRRSSIIIYATGDFTRGKSGSHIRFAQMIDFASKEFDAVFVYSYRNNSEDPWQADGIRRFEERFLKARLVLDDQTKALKTLFRMKNLALMAAPNHARSIVDWRLKGSAPALRELMATEPDAALLINFMDGVNEMNGVPIDRVWIDTIDSKFVRFAKFRGHPLWAWKSLARLRAELAVLGAAKGVIAISQVETGFFRTLLGNQAVLLVPTYSDPNALVPVSDGEKDVDMLFVGANNPYNRDGLKNFIRANGDLLQKRTLNVAGSVCNDEELKALAGAYSKVCLLGWVDDLAAVYRKAKVVIAPVDGTGLNIKVVEALEHAKPVFASAHARHALPPGHNECVFPLEIDKLSAMLDDPLQLTTAEAAAHSFASGPHLRGDVALLTDLLHEVSKEG